MRNLKLTTLAILLAECRIRDDKSLTDVDYTFIQSPISFTTNLLELFMVE
jgi:hypothetical protein